MKYKEYQNTTIPDFLTGPEWVDESWHHDAAAHSRYLLPDDSPYEMWVWVQADKVADREYPDEPKYWVSIYDKTSGDLIERKENAELETETARTKTECQAIIKRMLESINIIINNRRNADNGTTNPIA